MQSFFLLDCSPTLSTFGTFSTRTPSVEVRSDGIVVTEEMRAQWALQDNLLSHLTSEQKAAIMKVPAASNTEDIKQFARYNKKYLFYGLSEKK